MRDRSMDDEIELNFLWGVTHFMKLGQMRCVVVCVNKCKNYSDIFFVFYYEMEFRTTH